MNCPKCGGPMWDNREKKTNPKAPDFKCKDKDNCDGVIWPPRDGKPSPVSEAVATTSAWSTGPSFNENRSARIERQHSQEMAIRYLELTKTQMDNLEASDALDLVKTTTDWFQADLENS